MSVFNHQGRVKNSMKISAANLTYQILTMILNFAYRTIFIKVLVIEYLGLNGLFTDILHILSLAELGIGSSIAFRLYKPISNDNVVEVAQLMNFYKNVYRVIALVVTVIGLSIMPFLPYIIKDAANTLPQDVNLYVLYAVFLAQSVSGYFFAYKQTLLTSDQRGYVLTLFNIGSNIIKFAGQVAVLFVLKNYLFTLVFTIGWTIISNIIISIFVTKKYKEVFAIKEKLPKEQRNEIIKDTKALMLHKIGSTILTSTDSIIISAMIGLATNGVFSNYVMIINVIKSVFNQVMTGAGAGFGNLCASGDKEKIKRVFKNYHFLSLWISGFFNIGLMCMLNPFIEIWLNDPQFLMEEGIVALIIFSTYLVLCRTGTTTLINASGLFRKDKFRPLIEAGLNLVISIVATYFLGLYGVYIGTIASCLLTAFWREPLICYKYIFEEKPTQYWKEYFVFFIVTLIAAVLTFFAIRYIPKGIGYFILKLAIVCILPNAIFVLAFFRKPEFKYYLKFLKRFKKQSN